MTNEPPQDWHRPGERAVTFRLPDSYSGLSEWASAHGLQDALEIIFLSIGAFPDPRAIISLRDKVANETYRDVWRDWSDHPVASRMWGFFDVLYRNEDKIPRADSVYPLQGEAAKTKNHFSKEHAPILAPIIYLSQHREQAGSPELTRRYRLLMWLLVQCAHRVLERGSGTDSKIRKIARYLTEDSTSEHWASVDRLLRRVDNSLSPAPVTYERFTSHLLKAIELAKPPPGADRSLAGFLHALSDIARQQWGEDDQQGTTEWHARPDRYSEFAPNEPVPWSNEDLGDWTPLEPSEPDAEDESGEDEIPEGIITPVDPGQTALEQSLTSRAVFLHNAEQSHFLPWSWDKLLPPEISILEAWIDRELTAGSAISSLGAALVWLATHIGRSLYHTNRITISDDFAEEWSISTDFARIQRLSPRRHNSWQPKIPAAKDAVQPSSDRLTFSIPEQVSEMLLKTSRNSSSASNTIWDLWQSVSPTEKVEVWFDRQAREHFPRVTSGKLEQVAGQQIFNRSGDDHLARLLVAPPRSGLPAACGYASWDMNAIASGLPLGLEPYEATNTSTLFLGSLLAPLERLLTSEINKANRILEQSRSGDLISFHNRYATFCVMVLYAATGCRHLKSPFESILYFSFEHRCVYINDKTDDGVHAGRLVPLPTAALAILKQYLDYLEVLASALSQHNAELGEHIRGLASGADALPLFFLLDEALNWHQMTDQGLPGLPLFDWPLPANLFRHRYSQQMARWGVETDVIDGWIGHAERAVATYGDFSPRCWAEDARRYQQTIDTCFDALDFQPLSGRRQLPPYSRPDSVGTNDNSPPTVFGEEERRQERRLRRKRSTQRALIDIDEYLDGRELQALSEEEFEELSNRILLRKNGLPYNDAANRYRVLERKIRRLGGDCSRKIRTRYAQFSSEKSLVNAEAVSSLVLWEDLSRWRQDTQSAVNKSQMSRPEALCVGMALLCLEKRISYKRLVFDGLQGKHFRLVQHKKRYYFEYSEEWDPSDFSVPTQRHEVSYKVASLLAFGKGLKSSVDPNRKTCPKRVQGLISLVLGERHPADKTTLSTFFERLLVVVEQTNLVALPGMVAAALSERRPSTSLPWQDLLRLTEGKTVLPPGLQPDKEAAEINGLRINQGAPQEHDTIALQNEAKHYTRELLHLIKGYQPSKSRDCAKAIEKVSTRYTGKVSTAMLMLGYWIAHRIRQGNGRGKHHKPYAQSSVERYLIELRRSFEGVLYDKDLLAMGADQITDLYSDMLEACRGSGKRIDYFSHRLKEFQRWAESIGCEGVDWSELDTDDHIRSVNPGCLSEKDYLAAQRAIENQFPRGSDEGLFLGFVLLLTYRFGLRFSEATGLRRNDWCHYQKRLWVLVHNNHLRKLKRPSSRRAIPLLFPLTAQEQRLIDVVLARWQALSPAGENTPILCDASGGQAILSSKAATLSKTLVQILRATTGNPQLVLHHCRHSFHNVTASILLPIGTPLAKKLRKGLDVSEIGREILGDHHAVSRRTGMALARLMGHHRPNTSLVSYNHLLTDWADALTSVKSERTHEVKGVYNTRDFSSVEMTKPAINQGNLDLPPPDLVRIFRTLRLVACGKSFPAAGELNLLAPELIENLRVTFETANAKMRFKERGASARWFLGAESPNALLHYVTDTSWLRLLEHAESLDLLSRQIDPADYPPTFELPGMTGMNRHILMSHRRHCNLVRLVVSFFNIPDSAYEALFALQDAEIQQSMQDAGFNAIAVEERPVPGKAFQIDAFWIEVERKLDKREQRGGIIMKRNSEGVIRTSFELAVAILAMGVLIPYQRGGEVDNECNLSKERLHTL